MEDPIQLFLSSFWKLKLEILAFLICLVLGLEIVFSVHRLVKIFIKYGLDVLEFRCELKKRKVFDEMDKNKDRIIKENLT